MRGSAGVLLVLAAAAAVLVGAIVGQQALRPAESEPLLASTAEPAAELSSAMDLPEGALRGSDGSGMQAPLPALTAMPAPAGGATAAPVFMAAATARPTATPLLTRVPKPTLSGPRRVGIQAGHWLTQNAPPELRRLLTQTGTSWNGINEVTINLDIAERLKEILEPQGIVVDVLPTVIPPGYLADAFVALHGDGDGTGANSGYKMAFSARRTPHEAALMDAIKAHYGAATGLPYDQFRISNQMRGYYAMAWTSNKWSTAPHTPSVILEMGYVSHDRDRDLMLNRPEVVAGGIAEGIIRFLETHPREKLFGQDLIVQLPAPRTPTPRN